MHSINITLPWTIGVFMVRNYMGIGGNEVPNGHEVRPDVSSPAAAPISGHSTAPAPMPYLESNEIMIPHIDGSSYEDSLSTKQIHEEDADKVHLEARVGYMAGILSSAFSISQVLSRQPRVSLHV